MKVYLSQFYVLLAEGLLLAGDIDRAKQTAKRALDLVAHSGERGIEATALHVLGAALSADAADEAERAHGHYERAKTLGEELGMRPLVAHCHLGLGKLYWRTGMREQAQEQLTIATTMYSEMDRRTG